MNEDSGDRSSEDEDEPIALSVLTRRMMERNKRNDQNALPNRWKGSILSSSQSSHLSSSSSSSSSKASPFQNEAMKSALLPDSPNTSMDLEKSELLSSSPNRRYACEEYGGEKAKMVKKRRFSLALFLGGDGGEVEEKKKSTNNNGNDEEEDDNSSDRNGVVNSSESRSNTADASNNTNINRNHNHSNNVVSDGTNDEDNSNNNSKNNINNSTSLQRNDVASPKESDTVDFTKTYPPARRRGGTYESYHARMCLCRKGDLIV